MLKNFGLKIDEKIDEFAYIFGINSPLPKNVLNASRNWGDYLPTYEPQFNSQYDTSGCTVFGTLNVYEILMKWKTKHEYNFSERFNYILANITPPGADPHQVCEVIRKAGVIPEEDLPMTPSFSEYLKPKPMTKDLLGKGLGFPYELKHEYVWTGNISDFKRRKLIEENLQYSPLGVSVTAWFEEGGVYVDKGRHNTHWCVLYGISNKGYLIFDSYDHDKKILSFSHNIQQCKRYHLELRKPVVKDSWWTKLVVFNLLAQVKTLQNMIKGVMARETFYNSALGFYRSGEIMHPEDPKLGCGFAMDKVWNKAFPNDKVVLGGTGPWWNWMKKSNKWQEVLEPETDCVVVYPTPALPPQSPLSHGHIFIRGRKKAPDGSYWMLSNNSETGKFDVHWTEKSAHDYYHGYGKCPRFCFKLLG